MTYEWTLTLPAGYPTPLPPLTGSGSSVSVSADVAGTYSCEFTASADRDCPPNDVIIGSASIDTCQSATIASAQAQTCGITVTLKEITFQGDHTMYDEASPCDTGNRCWGAGAALTGPDWKSENNPNHAVCYTRSTAMVLVVRIEVEGSGGGTATLRVVGPDGVTGEGDFDVPCGTEERFVAITTSVLPGVVKAYTPTGLSWSVRSPGETTFAGVGTTSHRIYVTLGTPAGSAPTNRRVNFVCYAAAQAGDALTATEGIHTRLNANPPLDGLAEPPDEIQASDWSLMSGFPYYGECHHQAHLMNLAIQLLGLPAGFEYKTFASTDISVAAPEKTTASALGYTQDLDGNGVVGDEMFTLIFDFRPPAGQLHNWNNFEGSIYATGRYYAVWNSFVEGSACQLYQAVVTGEAAKQYWVFQRSDGTLEVFPTDVPGPATCP